MKRILQIGALLGISTLFGCSSMQTVYIPDQVGPSSEPRIINGLQVSIVPEQDTALMGSEIGFSVTVRNVSDREIQVPRNPDLIFTWVYPNGRRDNFVVETKPERFFRPSELIGLKPGQAVRYTKSIDTYYFPKNGITEFCALFHVPQNSNPGVGTVWSGRATSNRYGVLIDTRGQLSKADFQRSAVPDVTL